MLIYVSRMGSCSELTRELKIVYDVFRVFFYVASVSCTKKLSRTVTRIDCETSVFQKCVISFRKHKLCGKSLFRVSISQITKEHSSH